MSQMRPKSDRSKPPINCFKKFTRKEMEDIQDLATEPQIDPIWRYKRQGNPNSPIRRASIDIELPFSSI